MHMYKYVLYTIWYMVGRIHTNTYKLTCNAYTIVIVCMNITVYVCVCV